jgi:hypothetical protein
MEENKTWTVFCTGFLPHAGYKKSCGISTVYHVYLNSRECFIQYKEKQLFSVHNELHTCELTHF